MSEWMFRWLMKGKDIEEIIENALIPSLHLKQCGKLF